MSEFSFGWHDVVGITGVSMILLAYLGIQLERINGQSLIYSLINMAGAILIMISLYYTFNLASFIIECFWLAISILGIVRWLRRRNRESG